MTKSKSPRGFEQTSSGSSLPSWQHSNKVRDGDAPMAVRMLTKMGADLDIYEALGIEKFAPGGV